MSTMLHNTFTITTIRECRELGDSWPKAIRSSIQFKYLLGCRLLKVGEAITRAGYKLTGEQGSVEEIFDIGREYQRRVTAREALTEDTGPAEV